MSTKAVLITVGIIVLLGGAVYLATNNSSQPIAGTVRPNANKNVSYYGTAQARAILPVDQMTSYGPSGVPTKDTSKPPLGMKASGYA